MSYGTFYLMSRILHQNERNHDKVLVAYRKIKNENKKSINIFGYKKWVLFYIYLKRYLLFTLSS